MVLVQHELQNVYIGQRVDVTSLTLDKNSITLTTAWDTEQITATVVPSGTPITWSSSDTSVATVSSTWLVTCVTPWTATITAEAFGVTATCEVSGGGWTPWANTTLYLPLNWDITDPYNQVTYNWVWTSSFATWSTGVQAANFTWSNAIALGTSTDFIWNTWECTTLFWFTTTSPSTEQRCSLNLNWEYFMINRITGGKLNGHALTTSNEYSVSWTTSIVANTKYLATITRKENWKMCVYLNWNLEWETNIRWTFKSLPYQFWQHIGAWRLGNSEFWRWMIKDFIIENRERTAQEISDYYNQTKSNYWI